MCSPSAFLLVVARFIDLCCYGWERTSLTVRDVLQVLVMIKKLGRDVPGTVKFVGRTNFHKKTMVGVELVRCVGVRACVRACVRCA